MQYTKRMNLNRGYMKLEVWQESIGIVRCVRGALENIPNPDLRLRSQLLSAAQSISANIAEGYCRRTIREYLQFVGIALGSSGELMSRMIGLKQVYGMEGCDFEEFDKLHFSMENKLLGLRRSLEEKKRKGDWGEELPESLRESGAGEVG